MITEGTGVCTFIKYKDRPSINPDIYSKATGKCSAITKGPKTFVLLLSL